MFRLTVFVAIIHLMPTISSVICTSTFSEVGNRNKSKGVTTVLKNDHLLTAAFSAEVIALSCGVQLLDIPDTTLPKNEHLVSASSLRKLWKNLTTMDYVSEIVEEVAADTAAHYIKNPKEGPAYEYLFDTLERQILASDELKNLYSEVKLTINPASLMTTYRRNIGINDVSAIADKLPKEFQQHPDLRRLLIDIRFLRHASSFNSSTFDGSCKEDLKALLSRAILELSRQSKNRNKIQDFYDDATKVAAFEIETQHQVEWTACVDNILYPTMEERLREDPKLYKEIGGMSEELLGIKKKRKKKKKVLTAS